VNVQVTKVSDCTSDVAKTLKL